MRGSGQRWTASVDHAHAELVLRRSDAAAKLRRLQAQRLRRRRIGAEIGDLGEEIEVVEVSNRGHGAAPNYSIHDKYAFHFEICPADHCASRCLTWASQPAPRKGTT